MRKTVTLVIPIVLLLTLPPAAFAGDPDSAAAAGPEVYGAGVALAETTPIRAIVEEPDAWVGKEVRVEGRVAGVCVKKGCWMELQDPDGHHLRIKVEDDVIVFPAAAEGRQAVAQGTVEVNELGREEYLGWLRHMAEEQGRDFDEASLGEGPYRLVQLRGTGAEIAGGP